MLPFKFVFAHVKTLYTGGHWGLSLRWCIVIEARWSSDVCSFSVAIPVADNVAQLGCWLDLHTDWLLTCGADSFYQVLQSAWQSAAVQWPARTCDLFARTCWFQWLVPHSRQDATEENFNHPHGYAKRLVSQVFIFRRICGTVQCPEVKLTRDVGKSTYRQTTWEPCFCLAICFGASCPFWACDYFFKTSFFSEFECSTSAHI